jgi:SHS family lactate transporter-like MFS transporter
MGGEWGLGAALAMESLPTESRGLFSGILQEGYAFGYLLAAVVAALAFPHIGWRGMFLIGTLPALLVLFIRVGVPESPIFEERRARNLAGATGMLTALRRRWPLFLYLVLLMTAFNFMSHGSQDIYPTFLQKQVGLTVSGSSAVVILYNVGAICGGVFFGYNSQRWGRRRAIVIAAALGLLLVPLWAGLFSFAVAALLIGAFLMQFMVQGAWGVIPAHLNELSPGAVRGVFPGFAYQLGNLCAAITPTLLTLYANRLGSVKTPNFSMAQTILIASVFVVVIVVTWLGPESRAKVFTAAEDEELGVESVPRAPGVQPD